MSYGTSAGVGGMSALWSDNGVFSVSTTPTLAQVNTWLDQVSAMVDTALADEGFSVPVTVAAVVKELDLLVNGIANDLVDYSHKAGRFYSERSLYSGASPFMILDKEIHSWVQRKSVGFENQGVPKTETGRKVATFDML
jgi:hypothetical protein